MFISFWTETLKYGYYHWDEVKQSRPTTAAQSAALPTKESKKVDSMTSQGEVILR